MPILPASPKVAIYARVSTADQDADNQLLQLRAYAASQGWIVTNVYQDTASGKSAARRPQYAAMLEDASRHKWDILLFWSLDRLSREGSAATLAILDNLSHWRIGYRSYSESYIDSCGPLGDAVISILAAIAKQERVRLSERTKAGLAKARAKGRIGGRKPITETHPDVHHKVHAGRARGASIRALAAAHGISPTTVAALLKLPIHPIAHNDVPDWVSA